MPISALHNLSAAHVANTLSAHFQALSDSTRRLSSGLRIEQAADDAAGLAIRELMRADISALHQGVRNANDAISLIQTMDGALGVIEEKLIRMKELAEQAATGTYDSVQRLMIDSEFQAMGSEITRIALATDFNGIKLLAGAGGMAGFQQQTIAQWNFNDLADSSGNGNTLAQTGTVFTGGGNLTTVDSMLGNVSANLNVNGGAGFSISLTFNPALTAGAGAHAELFQFGNLSARATTTGELEVSLGGQSVQGPAGGVANGGNNSLEVRVEADNALHVILNGNDVGSIANATVGGGTLTIGSWSTMGVGVTFGPVSVKDNPDGAQAGGQTAVPGDPAPGKVLIHFGTGNDSAEDYYVIDKSNATLAGLGLANTDITTQNNAQTSLTRIGGALERHAEIRTYLGGLQNRLENTVTNLTVQSENTAAAESRISDVDVAQEMQTFVRNQVLSQAAVSMLAQANSLPGTVISRLVG